MGIIIQIFYDLMGGVISGAVIMPIVYYTTKLSVKKTIKSLAYDKESSKLLGIFLYKSLKQTVDNIHDDKEMLEKGAKILNNVGKTIMTPEMKSKIKDWVLSILFSK